MRRTVAATVHYYADFPVARPKAKRAGPLTASVIRPLPNRLIGGNMVALSFSWDDLPDDS